MTLSELVPSLDLCQQLKAAGFPQDTAMVWFHYGSQEHGQWEVWTRTDAERFSEYTEMPWVSAPTFSGLLDVLEPSQSSAEKMVALAHAFIALHEEVAG